MPTCSPKPTRPLSLPTSSLNLQLSVHFPPFYQIFFPCVILSRFRREVSASGFTYQGKTKNKTTCSPAYRAVISRRVVVNHGRRDLDIDQQVTSSPLTPRVLA
jgi:hypothetical protein